MVSIKEEEKITRRCILCCVLVVVCLFDVYLFYFKLLYFLFFACRFLCCSSFAHSAQKGLTKDAQDVIMSLWGAGYAATDIIQTLFKVL
jgi:hypothetical protein